ncbi:MAG TPA: hypothetical protein VHT53_13875 [Candidatus Elarobacter sp.]|nr:hypothetical protein [Candidatus Elarobacter sp.]
MLAACGGGSGATIANVSGNTSNLRIVNGVSGVAGVGNVDVYFQSTGSPSPTQTIVSNLAFGTASDYLTQPAVAGSVIVQHAGGGSPSGGTAQLASCPIPQMAINAKYSVVLVRTNGAVNCELFQDFDYTASPQYRAHDASPNSALAAGAGFGTEATPSAPPGSTFAVQTAGAQGALAAGNAPATAYTAAQPNGISAFTGSITFAVSAQTSGSATALATLDSRYIFSPNGTSQPNSSGALNFTGSAGTSIFAIDCTTNVAPNVPCTSGVALVGFTDRL